MLEKIKSFISHCMKQHQYGKLFGNGANFRNFNPKTNVHTIANFTKNVDSVSVLNNGNEITRVQVVSKTSNPVTYVRKRILNEGTYLNDTNSRMKVY